MILKYNDTKNFENWRQKSLFKLKNHHVKVLLRFQIIKNTCIYFTYIMKVLFKKLAGNKQNMLPILTKNIALNSLACTMYIPSKTNNIYLFRFHNSTNEL